MTEKEAQGTVSLWRFWKHYIPHLEILLGFIHQVNQKKFSLEAAQDRKGLLAQRGLDLKKLS